MFTPCPRLKSRTWTGAINEAVLIKKEWENKKNNVVSIEAIVKDNLFSFLEKYEKNKKDDLCDKGHIVKCVRHIKDYLFKPLAEDGHDAKYIEPKFLCDRKWQDLVEDVIDASKFKHRKTGELIEYTSASKRKFWQNIVAFFNFMSDEYNLFNQVQVPFTRKENPFEAEDKDPFEKGQEICNEDFQKVLAEMTNESTEMKAGQKRKEISIADLAYLPYMFYMAGITAQRRETIARMSWEDVFMDGNTMWVTFINYKVSKSKRNKRNKKKIVKHTIPCHPALKNLLIHLGYGKKTSGYIFYPEEEQIKDWNEGKRCHKTISREQLYIKKLSVSFSYFAKLAGVNLPYGSLKKTAVTDYIIQTGELASFYTGHARNKSVLGTFYESQRRSKVKPLETFVSTLTLPAHLLPVQVPVPIEKQFELEKVS